MKHVKIYENFSLNSMGNIIAQYNSLLSYIKPLVDDKFYELAEDTNYQPVWGDRPSKNADTETMSIIDISVDSNIVKVELQDYDTDGYLSDHYFIKITEEEISDYELRKDAKKYNI